MNSEERLKNLIAKLVLKDEYWGYLFSRARKEEFPIPSILGVQIATDGCIELLFNPEFIKNTQDDVLLLGLEHEGFHILNKHLFRLNDILDEFPEDKHKNIIELWNVASDICCNYLCDMPKIIKINGNDVYPHSASMYKFPYNLSAEYYFWKLLNNQKDNPSGQSMVSNRNQVGDHSQWPTKETQSMRKLEKVVQDQIFNAFKSVRDRGHMPAGLTSLINSALEKPKVPYYQIIRKLVRGSIFSKERNAFSRLNKKRSYAAFYKPMLFLPFPGREQDKTFKIYIVLDTSASMSNERIKEGLSGVKNIIESDKNCLTFVIECDAKIQNEYQIKRLSDINYEPKGRGGTVLLPAMTKAREEKANIVLVFTDAACDNLNMVDRKLLPKKIVYVVPLNNSISAIDRTGYIVRADY